MEEKNGNYRLGDGHDRLEYRVWKRKWKLLFRVRVHGLEIGKENVNCNNFHGESHRKEYGDDMEASVCVGNTWGYIGESCWGLRVI